ncbi:MAG: hypothetical protein IPI67_11815 [Myxococcales bacterium]|nr:hypothetical protein [Myxococcales bacterium]
MRAIWLLALLAVACTGSERATPAERALPSASPAAVPAPGASATRADESEHERLFFPSDPTLFEKKHAAKPGEWLDRFKEPGESFLRYKSKSPIRPDSKRDALVLQPLGSFSPKDGAVLEKMRDFMGAFFALPVELRSPISLPTKGRRTRSEGGRKWTQHHTRVLLDEVLGPRVPKNAVVYVGVTLEDLYPEPSWNFVFGQATLDERVGVYSLARFFPAFWAEPNTEAARTRGIAKSVQILVHETGHAFSMAHCTEYECVMNGSNSKEELDTQFFELCPVCLRKLAYSIGFAPKTRYKNLLSLYRKEGIGDSAHWLERRLRQLDGRPPKD